MRKKFTATIAKVLIMSLVVSLLGVSTDVEAEAAKKKNQSGGTSKKVEQKSQVGYKGKRYEK